MLIWGLSSCSKTLYDNISTETNSTQKDSTAVRDSLIYVPVPLGRDQAIVHVGDTSRLETQVAFSLAWIGRDGLLHHKLENRPITLPYRITYPEHFHLKVTDTKKAEIKSQAVYIEKSLSKWRKFKIGSFWYLCGAVALLLAWIFRKSLLKLIGK